MLVFADLDYWLFICLVCLKRSEFFDAFFLQLMKVFFQFTRRLPLQAVPSIRSFMVDP